MVEQARGQGWASDEHFTVDGRSAGRPGKSNSELSRREALERKRMSRKAIHKRRWRAKA